jgi:hypothetical protein
MHILCIFVKTGFPDKHVRHCHRVYFGGLCDPVIYLNFEMIFSGVSVSNDSLGGVYSILSGDQAVKRNMLNSF